MNAYISQREQRVAINDALSRSFKLKYGVPQGSCAGPIIFLTYISALYDVVKEFLPTVGAYADDIQVYILFKPNTLTQNSNISNIEQCVSAIRR